MSFERRNKAMQRKFVVLGLVGLILLANTTFIGCARDDMITEENSFYLPGVIEPGNLNDLTLTIYYIDFGTLIFTTLDVVGLTGGWCDSRERIVRGAYDYRAVIPGRNLIPHRDLINQLFATELNPKDTDNVVDARLHYVFEHKEYGEIFSFTAFARWPGDVFVNGIEVEHNNIFFEAILPFLPRNIAEVVSGAIE